jgi:hypothetical protein
VLAVESRVDIQSIHFCEKPTWRMTSRRNDHATESNAHATSTFSSKLAFLWMWRSFVVDCTYQKLSYITLPLMNALCVGWIREPSLGAILFNNTLLNNFPTR